SGRNRPANSFAASTYASRTAMTSCMACPAASSCRYNWRLVCARRSTSSVFIRPSRVGLREVEQAGRDEFEHRDSILVHEPPAPAHDPERLPLRAPRLEHLGM